MTDKNNDYFIKFIEQGFENVNNSIKAQGTRTDKAITDMTIKIENIHTKISDERKATEEKYISRKEAIGWAGGIGIAVQFLKDYFLK